MHRARLERSTVGWEPEHSSLAEGRLLWRLGGWPCAAAVTYTQFPIIRIKRCLFKKIDYCDFHYCNFSEHSAQETIY